MKFERMYLKAPEGQRIVAEFAPPLNVYEQLARFARFARFAEQAHAAHGTVTLPLAVAWAASSARQSPLTAAHRRAAHRSAAPL